MNKEYKYDGENTKVLTDNGQKTIETVDNTYDILTIENVIEFLNNLKNEEKENKQVINKQHKRALKFRLLALLGLLIGLALTMVQLYYCMNSTFLLDKIYLAFFGTITIFSAYKTLKYNDLEFNLNIKKKEIENNISYLELKENDAKLALDKLKEHSNNIVINEKESHKIDMNIMNIYKKYYESYKKFNARAMDVTQEEPKWDNYTSIYNNEEINIVKEKRRKLVK